MGIFGFFKRNTLKAIQWLDDSKNTIVYRFPMDGRRFDTAAYRLRAGNRS